MKGAAADDEKHGDISSDQINDDPTRLTSFGDESTEPPAPTISSDNALIDKDAEAPKPCISPVEMRMLISPASRLQHVDSDRTTLRNIFSPHPLLWSFWETIEEMNFSTMTTLQAFAKYHSFWHRKVMETKSRQNLVFIPGGSS